MKMTHKKGLTARFLVVAASFLFFLLIGRAIWSGLNNLIVREELRSIYRSIGNYTNDQNGRLPQTLEFLEDEPYRGDLNYFWENVPQHIPSRLRRIVRKVLGREETPSEVVSRIHYVWLGEDYYNFFMNICFVTKPKTHMLRQVGFFGEFNYDNQRFGPDCPGGDLSWKGLPLDQVVLLAYQDPKNSGKLFVCTASEWIYTARPEEVKERIVLQKAFLRQPLQLSDKNILIKGLSNVNSGYQFRCAEALARLGQSEGRLFLDRMSKSEDATKRIRAAEALARIGAPYGLEYLREAEVHSTDHNIRLFAKLMLEEMSGEKEGQVSL